MAEEDRQRSIKELLAAVDTGMREIPMPQREPAAQPIAEVANLTGDVLRRAVSNVADTVLQSLDEADGKLKAQRLSTETVLNNLRTFIDMLATQNTEVVNVCIAVEKTVNELADRIMAIGKPPPNSNGKGDTSDVQ